MRGFLRGFVVSCLLAGLCGAVGVSAASATRTARSATSSWTHKVNVGTPAASTASATWLAGTAYLQLTVSTGTLASGKCVTIFFDWTSNGHHDSRALRDCKSNDSIAHEYGDVAPANITGGPSKLAVCYAADNKKGVCDYAGAEANVYLDWSVWPDLSRTSPCDETWVKRTVAGDLLSFVDPHPLSATVTSAGTC